MATQNNTISPVPNNQPVINKNNMMITQVWSSFFNDLFTRIGGPTANTNLELQNAIASVNAISKLTGDVVANAPSSGIGPATSSIQPNVVTNGKLAEMPAFTIKGNNTNIEGNALDLTGSEVAAFIPFPSQFVFKIGPQSNTASSLIVSPTFVNFNNSPTLTFIPSSTGTYKVYASIPLEVTNAVDTAQVQIIASSGSPTLLASSIGNLSGASAIQSNQFVQSVFTLTAGTSYSFDVQGQCSSSAGCKIPAIDYYIFAEKVA